MISRPEAMEKPLKLLYIVGWGRSGSTILGTILGQIDGFFFVGELRNVWQHYRRGEDRRCGCGAGFRECRVWRDILTDAFGEPDEFDASEMVRLRDTLTRTRHLSRLFMGRRDSPEASRLRELLGRLYHSIQRVTGANVIVDTSKHPAYAKLLADVLGVDLRIVHLVRDPRAAAYSWRRRKLTRDTETPRYLMRIGLAESSALWCLWNVAAERLGSELPHRYLRVRYEDFVAEPRHAIARMRELAGSSSPLPFTSERTVFLRPVHSVMGNPVRFDTGEVRLQGDHDWREQMSSFHRALVTATTWPLLLRYGYSP